MPLNMFSNSLAIMTTICNNQSSNSTDAQARSLFWMTVAFGLGQPGHKMIVILCRDNAILAVA